MGFHDVGAGTFCARQQGVVADEAQDYRARALRQREEMAAYSDVTLPTEIFGEEAPPLATPGQSTLRAVPTARGYYQGPARVVRGIEDFEKVTPGCVLVIPFSDVGWTPLFARAGAVVAEAGGMRSHSSIVAREFGIPAVVSVAGACRLRDDVLLTVDGFTGEISMHEEAPARDGEEYSS